MGSFSTLALSLLMSLFFASLYTNEGAILPLITVNITNALESRNKITVHCKSGNDDLGVHQLPSSAGYTFNFHPNILDTTLFFCSFQWPGSSHYFDIYKDMRDRERCNNLCLWTVAEKGVCLFNYDTKKYDLCYAWASK